MRLFAVPADTFLESETLCGPVAFIITTYCLTLPLAKCGGMGCRQKDKRGMLHEQNKQHRDTRIVDNAELAN